MSTAKKASESDAPDVGPSAKRTRVSGMDRALQILDHLYETNAPAGGYAIAKAINAPLSTTYVAVIDELVERDMLTRRADGLVWLGPRLYHGLVYARSLDFLAEAGHAMDELCREIGETVQICGRDNDHMVVLAMADGPGHFRVMSEVGTRVPLNWTASGRLLVGYLARGRAGRPSGGAPRPRRRRRRRPMPGRWRNSPPRR